MATIDTQTTLQATLEQAWQVVRAMAGPAANISLAIQERLIVVKYWSTYTVYLLTPARDGQSVTLRYIVTDEAGVNALRAARASINDVVGDVAVDLKERLSTERTKAQQQIQQIEHAIADSTRFLATRRRRLAAVVADLGFLVLAGILLGFLLSFAVPLFALRVPLSTINLIALVAQAGYFIVLIARDGQTVGKRLLQIRVVAADGSPVGYRRSILRYVGSILSAIPFGAGYLWALIDKQRQAGYDKIAGTLVVRDDGYQIGAAALGIDRRTIPRQRLRWIAGLTLASGLVLFYSSEQLRRDLNNAYSLGQVLQDTHIPSELAGIDLSGLGFARSEVVSARLAGTDWSNGHYTSGALAFFGDGKALDDVAIWVLRYDSVESAALDFGANGFFGAYYGITVLPSGRTAESIVFVSGHGTRMYEDSAVSAGIYWYGSWIIDITVAVSPDRPSAAFIDQIRQAIMDQWAEGAEDSA